VDHGTYPFVTSSSSTAGGACTGTGFAPTKIDGVLGVVKAYTTAVGAGPMPTELHDATGDRIRQVGQEFGATTGRPRRCGWFDAVAARYAAEVAGFTELAVTKMDVLDGLETVKIATAYRHRGEELDGMPDTPTLAEVEPVYETLAGWRLPERVTGVTDLPPPARQFIDRLTALLDVPVTMIGLGRGRDALIRTGPFAQAARE